MSRHKQPPAEPVAYTSDRLGASSIESEQIGLPFAIEDAVTPDKSLSHIERLTDELVKALGYLPEDQRITHLNAVRLALHEVSPFKTEPVDCVLWLPAEAVKANEYNPNAVAPPEMRLLARSIEQDGYTQPIVGHGDASGCEIVDGFHRNRVGRENPRVRKRVKGHLPVALVRNERGGEKERIAATIRHNRARGVHGVRPMADIVARLLREGWSDEEVARELGMDADEVLRFKQHTGLPELFKNNGFSRSWA